MKKIKTFLFLIGISSLILIIFFLGNTKKTCSVEGIALSSTPNARQIEYISLIKPYYFGLVGPTGPEWINKIDSKKVFRYNFKKFYGSRNFSELINFNSEVKNIDVIGYCPLEEDLNTEEFSRRIYLLKEKFPRKQILLGPCVDLFAKVNKSEKKPDILGFEIFEKDFDSYLKGEYNPLVDEALKYRTDVYMYLTLKKDTDLWKLEKVVDRATLQKLKIGYGFDGNDRIFDFIIKHHCKQETNI